MSGPSSTDLKIQPGDPVHAEILAELHRASFVHPWNVAALSALMLSPGTVTRIAVLTDGMPAGFCLLRAAAGEAEVLTFCVHPDCRRLGIGRALLDDSADTVRALGAVDLFLEVSADNTAAITLYRSCGFEEVGRRAEYYQPSAAGAPPQDALLLKRVLIP